MAAAHRLHRRRLRARDARGRHNTAVTYSDGHDCGGDPAASLRGRALGIESIAGMTSETTEKTMGNEDVGVSMDGHVATVEIRRPPNNFLDIELIANLASVLEALDDEAECRAVVLAAAGKHFCAGANLGKRIEEEAAGKAVQRPRHLYHEARRLVATRKPIIAAVHGSAIGAGLGLALVADFRVTCKEARLACNFAALGYHPGFGMTVTLPRLVGHQRAKWLAYTGRRIPGDEAVAMGLADRLTEQ